MGRIVVIEPSGALICEGVPLRATTAGILDSHSMNALGLRESDRLLQCLTCGQLFIGHYASRCCSPDCAKVRVADRADRRKQDKADERRGTCPVCGSGTEPERSTGVYCSVACRQKAYRRRVREERAELKAQQTERPFNTVNQTALTNDDSSRASLMAFLNSQKTKGP